VRSGMDGVLNPRVPIIAMTAHAMAEDRRRWLEAGMDDYIAKPVEGQTLHAVLTRWITRMPAGDPSAGTAPAKPSSAVFDQAFLLGRLGGDYQVMREVIGLFLADVPRRLASLEQAVAGGDKDAIREQAHALKGAAGTVGADALGQAACALEQNASSADAPAREVALDGVREAFAAFRRAVDAMMKTDDGGAV